MSPPLTFTPCCSLLQEPVRPPYFRPLCSPTITPTFTNLCPTIHQSSLLLLYQYYYPHQTLLPSYRINTCLGLLRPTTRSNYTTFCTHNQSLPWTHLLSNCDRRSHRRFPLQLAHHLLLSRFRLFECGKYSDLTIVCGAKRYPVHRVLLATRSSFFEGACRDGFQEASTGVIDLTEDDAEAVEHMVHCKSGNCRSA